MVMICPSLPKELVLRKEWEKKKDKIDGGGKGREEQTI
jgi:hypothetical protein